jgi:hypothetical protein
MDELVAQLTEGLQQRLGLEHRRHVRIPKYTPNQNIRVWMQAFEQRCEVDEVPEEQSKSEVLANMDVQTSYAAILRLEMPDYLDYQEFKRRIIERFSNDCDAYEARTELRSRIQSKTESVEEYADKLAELATVAFPNMDREQREEEIVHQFVQGVRTTPGMRKSLIISRPRSVQEVKRLLRQMEAAEEMVGRSSAPCRASGQEAEMRKLLDQQQQQLQEQSKLLKQLQQQQAQKAEQGWGQPALSQRPVPTPSSIKATAGSIPQAQGAHPPQVCYACGELGHMKRQCPQRPPLPKNAQAAGAQRA